MGKRVNKVSAAVMALIVALAALGAGAATYTVPAGRSPIPRPGETFPDGPIPAKRLAPETTRTAEPPAPGEVVPWGRAHQHVGQRITVKGRIVNTHNTGSVCFLNFDHNWQDKFYLIVFEDAFADIPRDPADHFRNKTIRATGKVHTHKGRPQIRITNANQIEIVDE